MPGRPAQQPPQDVAPPFIGGQNPVGNHKGSGADVVCDDPEGYVRLMALAVGAPVSAVTRLVMFMTVSTSNRQSHALARHGQTLQAHAGVDVLLGQLGVVAVAVVVELGEDVVPDLHIPVAVAAHGAAGLAAAVLGPRS